jgi:hypothetical protein
MPNDMVIKAIGDLSAEIKKEVNKAGTKDMEVLKKMNDILNNLPPEIKQRMPSKQHNMMKPVADNTLSSPRVDISNEPAKEPPNRTVVSYTRSVRKGYCRHGKETLTKVTDA